MTLVYLKKERPIIRMQIRRKPEAIRRKASQLIHSLVTGERLILMMMIYHSRGGTNNDIRVIRHGDAIRVV